MAFYSASLSFEMVHVFAIWPNSRHPRELFSVTHSSPLRMIIISGLVFPWSLLFLDASCLHPFWEILSLFFGIGSVYVSPGALVVLLMCSTFLGVDVVDLSMFARLTVRAVSSPISPLSCFGWASFVPCWSMHPTHLWFGIKVSSFSHYTLPTGSSSFKRGGPSVKNRASSGY